MAKSGQWEVKTRKIFLFLFEDDKSFFLNDSTQNSDWKYYDGHYRERYACTREHFARCKKQNILPPMYLLDTIIGTETDAFQRKIEWSKYFVQQGYHSLLGAKMEEILYQFDPETSDFYRSIQDISLAEVCAPEKNVMSEYRNSSKNQRTEKSRLAPGMERISLIVRTEEHQKYKQLAQEYGVSMSEYIRDCARFGGVFQVDTSFLERYAHKLDECYNTQAGMLATYLSTGEYYPADIRKMEEIVERYAQINDEVKREIVRLCRQLRQMKNGKQLNADPLQ